MYRQIDPIEGMHGRLAAAIDDGQPHRLQSRGGAGDGSGVAAHGSHRWKTMAGSMPMALRMEMRDASMHMASVTP